MCLSTVKDEKSLTKDLFVKKYVIYHKDGYYTGIARGEAIKINEKGLTRNTGFKGRSAGILQNYKGKVVGKDYKVGFHFYNRSTLNSDIKLTWRFSCIPSPLYRVILCKIPKGSRVTVGVQSGLKVIVAQQFYFVKEL